MRLKILIMINMLCIVLMVKSEDDIPKKLKLSARQLEAIAATVCRIAKGHEKFCKQNFNKTSSSVGAGQPVSFVMKSLSKMTVAVPSSARRQLVLVLPSDYHEDFMPIFKTVAPSTHVTNVTFPYGVPKQYHVWSSMLDDRGVPGRWTFCFKPAPVVADKVYHIKFEQSIFDDYKVNMTFSWNNSYEPTTFTVTNNCELAELGRNFYVHVYPSQPRQVTVPALQLGDRCELNVSSELGAGALLYRTPRCVAGTSVCVPEPLEDLRVMPILVDNSKWNFSVSWKRPSHQPSSYDVSVNSDSIYEEHVAGNETEAVVPNVNVSSSFVVCVDVISLVRNQTVCTNEMEFPRMKQISMRLALTGSGTLLALVLAVAGAVGAGWLLRRRTRLTIYDYYQGLECKKGKEDSDLFAGVIIQEDHWEVHPERLSLYEVVGEGAFGVVRRGSLAPTGKKVAVKMLKDCPSVEEIRSFRAEIELMKSVGAHTNVVSLVGCCSKRSLMVIVEYCSRGDLLTYLRCASDIMTLKRNAKYYTNNEIVSATTNHDEQTKPQQDYSKFVINKLYDLQSVCEEELTAVDLISFCRQIAMGMEFLASNRVIHRDLAARNILVTADKTLKIADFGLSRDVYQENLYKQKGTGKMPFKWMALESINHRLYTSQSDVWSFGIVMWEIVTLGGSPYPGLSNGQLLRLLRAGYRMPRPANCSKELYELMRRCWAARALERPTFAELHARLDAVLDGASAHPYLVLDQDLPDILDQPPLRYISLFARGKRYWSNKREVSAPPNALSNHYTSPPDSMASACK